MSYQYWAFTLWVAFISVALVTGCATSESEDGGGYNGGDSDSDNDSDSDGDNDGDADNDGQSGVLTGVIRDFEFSHPDFEYVIEDDMGNIVAEDLGSDNKPVYAGGSDGTVTTNGEEAFNQRFNDVDGVNRRTEHTITLTSQGGDLVAYDDTAFFPIDDDLIGNEGNEHNYHFTYELHTRFTYKGGEVFRFRGDDDVFVFINGKLAIDIGGVHAPIEAEIDLDVGADYLGIELDEEYPLDFFFAERHTTESNFRIETTISDLSSFVVK